MSATNPNTDVIKPIATILIVDDEMRNRELLETMLGAKAYVTRSAANGEEALASIAECIPDLILLDIMMPGMDGYQVAGILKDNPATANIPIIMVTAKIDRKARLAALNAGAEEFLAKPVDQAELLLRVRNLLRLKTMSDLLQDHNLDLERRVAERTVELQSSIDALRESQVQLSGIVESTADGILAVDSNGKVIRANRRFAEMWRIPKALLDTGDDQALLGFVMGQLNDPDAFVKNVHALYESNKDDMDTLTFKDGRSFERYSAPLILDGSAYGRVLSFRDNTEHKRSEDALRAAEEQFRGLVEQSIAGIYIIQDDKLAYANPRFAEIAGLGSAKELVGTDLALHVVEADLSRVEENRRRLVAGEVKSVAFDFGALRRDGVTIQLGANIARATHGGRPAIIGMLQDISDKKRAEEEILRYIEQLKTALSSTIDVATIISEMRDPYTAGHERRVADIAVAIGAELGFDMNRQEGLRIAGLLHDIGKTTIPAEILSKPGKLSKIQFQLIQEHAQASYAVLKGVEFPWPVAQVALQHHERFDGSGYPQGLKGEAILLEARIMAVADVVEAMSSHRPYRPGLGIELALSEIESGRDCRYDAQVADACLRLFRERAYLIPG